ncbi:hypothetical protein LTR36_004483 [Oleoguttula mirabilis]|uniref:YDG domain-containing protein n=1 Tax=Oleoguttula mirabilis TaxID=1507867 RepID=A0AAV9JG83_9PEZI|nr:hypothetical protein LTR36_004483 [Oleoguttula mirabilis]
MQAVARSMSADIDRIKDGYNNAIKRIANTSQLMKTVPLGDSGGCKTWYARLDKFLAWLETEVRMTFELKKRSVIVTALQTIYAKEVYHFPATYADRARALYERWESEGWHSGGGAGGGGLEGLELDDALVISNARWRARKESAAPAGGVKPGTIKLPPKEHYIWGMNGIMHGVAMKISDGNKKGTVFDPRYKRRSSKVHGHNGIAVGTWYPRQLVALFRGAHGHQQAGITGDEKTGAFSIVVSGQYDLLDRDRGEYLYYSGSHSHDNESPNEPAPSAPGTLALHTSLETGEAVRVLRSHTGKSRHAPSVGLRYDGLYRVVSVSRPKNAKGGLYEQFKLERMGEQGEINQFRPNAREIRQFGEINEINTSRWEILQQTAAGRADEEES